VAELKRLQGKNALITGAGSGVGRATAHRFIQEGASNIFILDKRQERIDRVVGEIKALGGNATGILADVSNRDDLKRTVDFVAKTDGRLDILIGNAPAWTQEPFLDMKWESWDYVTSVILTASFILGQLTARLMKDHGGGAIAFTSSIDFKGAAPSFSHYGIAKAAIVNLVQNMAFELAQYNIRVNCVSPGPLDTQQSVDIVGEELMVKFRKHFPPVPLGHKLGTAEDIAAAFAYLVSEDAKYVTGQNIVVDGGLTTLAYTIPAPTED
jgi:NAD(P)-dependent dehydrogenase (short-subunit alcohol dehydrogenase family)